MLALTLLPNGLLASGAADNTTTIWDVTKTFPYYTLNGHTDVIRSLTVINKLYLASSSNDMTIKLWSLTSYKQVQSWLASSSRILSLAYDQTLNVLASGEFTPTNLVKIWSSSIWTNVSTTSGKYVCT